MPSINNGGSAFPRAASQFDQQPKDGMSLRDYFAGQALTGIMGDPGMRPSDTGEFAHLASRLYQLADAMIAARHEAQS